MTLLNPQRFLFVWWRRLVFSFSLVLKQFLSNRKAMALLVKYSPRDENRYSTFGSPSNAQNSTNNDNFESFNQFKLCDTHKIIKKQKEKHRQKFNFARINYILKNCCCCRIYNGCSCWRGGGGRKKQKKDTYNEITQRIVSLKKLQDIDDEEEDIFCSNIPQRCREKIGNGRYNASGTLQSEMQTPGKKAQKWTWNESLRSNSDKFLETLEYDDLLIIDRSLKRMKKAAKVRPIAYRVMGGDERKMSCVRFNFNLIKNLSSKITFFFFLCRRACTN